MKIMNQKKLMEKYKNNEMMVDCIKMINNFSIYNEIIAKL